MNPNKSAVVATDVSPRAIKSVYPEPFASRFNGRTKRSLGDFFGIKKFGVNLTDLEPGAASALLHRHSKQEEFIFVLSGNPTLVLENEEVQLSAGMCAGFIPSGSAHQIVNRTSEKVIYIEIGDRESSDVVTYPVDDFVAEMKDGTWAFCHKDGRPY